MFQKYWQWANQMVPPRKKQKQNSGHTLSLINKSNNFRLGISPSQK
jgi:hypothetical protein